MSQKRSPSYKEAIVAVLDEFMIILILVGIFLYYLSKRGIMTLPEATAILAAIASIGGLLVVVVVKAQTRPPAVGYESLIGEKAKVIEDLNPEGKVLVRGEIWKAVSRSGKSISKDRIVRIVDARDMTLIVEEEQ